MAISLKDLNFGYSRDPAAVTTGVTGDPVYGDILKSPTEFAKKFANNPTVGWLNTISSKFNSEDKSRLWNDLVADYGKAYTRASGKDWVGTKDTVTEFANALSNLRLGNAADVEKTSGWGAKGPVNQNFAISGTTFDPTTGTYKRSLNNIANPYLNSNNANNWNDTFDSVWDYALANKTIADDNTTLGTAGKGISNFNNLSTIFSNASRNRLMGDLTKAYNNMTGSTGASMPIDIMSKYGANTYDYYTDPSKYDTDYKQALGDLYSSYGVKQAIDPQYQYALGKLKFADNDANRNSFYDAASRYGINQVRSDVDAYKFPEVTTTNTDSNTVGGVGVGTTNTGGTTVTTNNGTGTGTGSGTNTTANPTYNYADWYTTRNNQSGQNMGSRYFSEQTGEYENQYPNVFGTNQGGL